MKWNVFRWVYSALCGLLATVGLWFAWDDWRRWHRMAVTSTSLLVAFSVLFALTAFFVARRWRPARWLAGATGVVLILYAASVVLMGWEDVGGAAGAIPLALGTGIAGCLGLLAAASKRTEMGAS